MPSDIGEGISVIGDKYEVKYGGSYRKGDVYSALSGLTGLVREAEILEVLTRCLSSFLEASVREMPAAAVNEWGAISLSRIDAPASPGDRFCVRFYPSNRDRGPQVSYYSCVLAEGRILERKIDVRVRSSVPEYVTNKIVPFLRDTFRKLGFVES